MTNAYGRVLEDFRAHVARHDTSRIRVHLEIAGGMPDEQRVDRSIDIDNSGQTRVTLARPGRAPRRHAWSTIDPETLTDILRKLGEGAEGLAGPSQARFLPDSVVGRVTLEVDRDAIELFFLADKEDRITQGKPIPPAAAEALDYLRQLIDQLLVASHDED